MGGFMQTQISEKLEQWMDFDLLCILFVLYSYAWKCNFNKEINKTIELHKDYHFKDQKNVHVLSTFLDPEDL